MSQNDQDECHTKTVQHSENMLPNPHSVWSLITWLVGIKSSIAKIFFVFVFWSIFLSIFDQSIHYCSVFHSAGKLRRGRDDHGRGRSGRSRLSSRKRRQRTWHRHRTRRIVGDGFRKAFGGSRRIENVCCKHKNLCKQIFGGLKCQFKIFENLKRYQNVIFFLKIKIFNKNV